MVTLFLESSFRRNATLDGFEMGNIVKVTESASRSLIAYSCSVDHFLFFCRSCYH